VPWPCEGLPRQENSHPTLSDLARASWCWCGAYARRHGDLLARWALEVDLSDVEARTVRAKVVSVLGSHLIPVKAILGRLAIIPRADARACACADGSHVLRPHGLAACARGAATKWRSSWVASCAGPVDGNSN
jgi:hypothetical protein